MRATARPAELLGRLPAVLVTPPRVAFDQWNGATTCTWRLLVVSDTTDEATAWAQLDDLLTRVAARLPVESAEPSLYAAGGDARPTPAYALTYTDTVES